MVSFQFILTFYIDSKIVGFYVYQNKRLKLDLLMILSNELSPNGMQLISIHLNVLNHMITMSE